MIQRPFCVRGTQGRPRVASDLALLSLRQPGRWGQIQLPTGHDVPRRFPLGIKGQALYQYTTVGISNLGDTAASIHDHREVGGAPPREVVPVCLGLFSEDLVMINRGMGIQAVGTSQSDGKSRHNTWELCCKTKILTSVRSRYCPAVGAPARRRPQATAPCSFCLCNFHAPATDVGGAGVLPRQSLCGNVQSAAYHE